MKPPRITVRERDRIVSAVADPKVTFAAVAAAFGRSETVVRRLANANGFTAQGRSQDAGR
ncbi:hypothetical protein [Roseisolibacter sp. H3M3-2]|uniref:hypothetical protein n=1 Tax=Roseisolibacter sp. H3M3-2 TaxID=3031323 RepID=UPI0023DC0004|nr:hypothetical protein [Roseisolibacter sp. H3M3-2]MDF1506214.1 hypothetical protein [Roseisolibacter sp. H3M3-2]